jgi:glycosyltransferase involved in cell wall biosynthesis
MLLLNVSVRWRGLLRDMAFCMAAGRPYAIHLHGVGFALADALLCVAPVRRWFQGAELVFSLCDAQDAWLGRMGVRQERVKRTTTCFEPSEVPNANEYRRDQPHLVYVGRLEPEKGLRRLLAAIYLLGPESPRVTVAGVGGLLPELRRCARDNGLRVDFPGWVQGADKRRLLASATVGVLHSSDEACPVFALEALASGCWLVSSDVGALPDLVRDQGIVLPTDAGAGELALALRQALQRPTPSPRRAVAAFHPSHVGERLGAELARAAGAVA